MALAAVAGFSLISMSADAAVITLTGATGSSCSYSSMSVQPDGSFNVICQGGSTTPQTDAGSFAFASATGVASVGNLGFYTVSRTGGTTGAVSMNYTVSGAGCTNGVGTLSFAQGDQSQSAIVRGVADGVCSITLGTPALAAGNTADIGPRLGAQASATITVGAGGGSLPPVNPPVDTSACPTGFTAPAELITGDFKPVGNVLLQMQKSGQVVALKMPSPSAGQHSVSVVFSESAGGAYTPQPVALNISISKCPGLIDPTPTNTCNLVSTNGNYNQMTVFTAPFSSIQDAASASKNGYCFAPSSQGQWYVNAKWTYSSCAFGASICGFAVQQNMTGW
jgi:hypothetical protein